MLAAALGVSLSPPRRAIGAASRALDETSHGAQHGEQFRGVGVTFPFVQRQRVYLTEAERRLHIIECHGQIDAAHPRRARFVMHELAFWTE